MSFRFEFKGGKKKDQEAHWSGKVLAGHG